jgi:DNA-binding NtrC family response regulator
MKPIPINLDQLKLFVQQGGTWQDLQKSLLIAALEEHQGNRTYVARTLGVSVRTIRNKMKTYQLRDLDYGQAKSK